MTESATPRSPLASYGWNERVAAWAEPQQAAGRRVGRVVRVSRHVDVVRLAEGEVSCERRQAAHRTAGLVAPPVVGDWVAVELHADADATEDGAALVALMDRWGTLARRDPARRDVEQVVVADVDLVLLVFGLDRPLRPGRLERVLALVHAGGAEPVVVLSKADVAKHRAGALEVLDGVRSSPIGSGPAVVEVSAATGQGLDELAAMVAGAGTAVVVGESGAGKSTLVNALVGEDRQGVAEVRAGDRKGRHTTTGRELFPLPGGGAIIDTPGLRALGLWDDQGVDQAFPDIEELARSCRFRDCGHRGEPGCAVEAAVADGRLDARRLGRYLALQDEVAALERRRLDRERRRPDRTARGSRGTSTRSRRPR